MMKKKFYYVGLLICGIVWCASGCTVKAVGDPNRPITINAHITVDVKGMQNTANTIEDFVSGKTDQPFTTKK
jgi:hypothetical protein